ncbi:hypothetical protein [Spirosoma sp. KNUC1025]|uniref:hypothetical protein n=1 Tax=Spirosoma sp. KNUC1025 TaxID=2894082 RepID=UPI00386EBD01|nr:hypothetical protein LN737_04560 [Spirosoma sp. KNUC1025]
MVKLFGSTIQETLDAFKPVHMGRGQPTNSQEDKTKAIARIIFTFLLFFFSVYLIVNDKSKDVGTTIIGGIIGYWLK